MDTKIIHRVDDTITAYIDGEKVKICYVTGYLSGKGNVKIQFQTEDERLKKFVEYCESEFKTKFEIVTEKNITLNGLAATSGTFTQRRTMRQSGLAIRTSTQRVAALRRVKGLSATFCQNSRRSGTSRGKRGNAGTAQIHDTCIQ